MINGHLRRIRSLPDPIPPPELPIQPVLTMQRVFSYSLGQVVCYVPKIAPTPLERIYTHAIGVPLWGLSSDRLLDLSVIDNFAGCPGTATHQCSSASRGDGIPPSGSPMWVTEYDNDPSAITLFLSFYDHGF